MNTSNKPRLNRTFGVGRGNYRVYGSEVNPRASVTHALLPFADDKKEIQMMRLGQRRDKLRLDGGGRIHLKFAVNLGKERGVVIRDQLFKADGNAFLRSGHGNMDGFDL